MNNTKSGNKYGFTGKVSTHQSGLYLNLPGRTIKSAQLKDKQLLHLQLRNMNNKTKEITRKVNKNGDKAKIYLPKQVREDLDLEDKDLLDVFFRKD